MDRVTKWSIVIFLISLIILSPFFIISTIYFNLSGILCYIIIIAVGFIEISYFIGKEKEKKLKMDVIKRETEAELRKNL